MRATTQDNLSMWVQNNVLRPLLMILIALATAFTVTWLGTMDTVAGLAHGHAFGDGPSPAAQTSANMPQARLTVHYNRVFMQWLYAYLNKLAMISHMEMPEKSGQTFRNFMSITLGPDVQQQTEGTIGPPEQINVNLKDITLAQFANYNNISDFAYFTSISNDMEENRKIMAYQLAFTIDDIVMYQMDYLRTLDSRTTNQDSTVAPYAFTKNIIEQMPGSLAGANVPRMADGWYNGSIHPFFVSDMLLDNSNNSIVDIWKHTDMGQVKLEKLGGEDGESPVRCIELFDCHWRQSTNRTQTANWEGSGLTGISTYLAGMDALVFLNFENKRFTKAGHNWKNMDLWAGEYKDRTAYDPNGLIIGGTGYNCVLGCGLVPDTTSRMRIAIAVPQTS